MFQIVHFQVATVNVHLAAEIQDMEETNVAVFLSMLFLWLIQGKVISPSKGKYLKIILCTVFNFQKQNFINSAVNIK